MLWMAASNRAAAVTSHAEPCVGSPMLQRREALSETLYAASMCRMPKVSTKMKSTTTGGSKAGRWYRAALTARKGVESAAKAAVVYR